MCGICGVVASRSEEGAEVIVRRMMAAMARRGPDEEGLLLTSSASVGMRRLSIIDLRGGSQPAWNEDCTMAVVYNGELYNFRELREELERAGHIFRSQSDTEVIVHAYEAWGEDCVKRFRGMFAFAAIEMPQGSNGAATRVFLARDPLGIKPLYYTTVDGALFFRLRGARSPGQPGSTRSPVDGRAPFLPAFWVCQRAGDPGRGRIFPPSRPFHEYFCD